MRLPAQRCLRAVSPQGIGSLGLTLSSPTTGEYGSEHCGGAPTGAWDCDDSQWWLGPDGEDIQTVWQVKVGAHYNLMDVDCYDETFARGNPGFNEMVTGKSCAR